MDGLLGPVRIFHAACGATALLSMTVPIATRKGSPLHRRAGLVYVGAMACVATSAWGVALLRVANGTAGPSMAFLSLVAWVAGFSVLAGFLALRARRGEQADRIRRVMRGVASLGIVIGGVGLVGGWLTKNPLLGVFGGLAAWLAWGRLRSWRAPGEPRWWLFEHLQMMLAGCISTVTAFLVVNFSNAPQGFRDAVPPLLVWLAPTIVGTPAIALWTRAWRRPQG